MFNSFVTNLPDTTPDKRTDAARQHRQRLYRHRAKNEITKSKHSILTSILVQKVRHGGLLIITVDYYQMTLWMKRDTELIGCRPAHPILYVIITAVDCWHICEVLRAICNVRIQAMSYITINFVK